MKTVSIPGRPDPAITAKEIFDAMTKRTSEPTPTSTSNPLTRRLSSRNPKATGKTL